MAIENHKHTGMSGDGSPINTADLINHEVYLFIPGTSFEDSDVNAAYSTIASFGTIVFPDNLTSIAACSFMIPVFKKGIRKMRLLYYNGGAGLDLYLSFNITKGRLNTATIVDSLAITTYTSFATTGKVAAIDINKSLWDALLLLNPLDIIGFKVTREGANAADTYGAGLHIVGLLVEFS